MEGEAWEISLNPEVLPPHRDRDSWDCVTGVCVTGKIKEMC